MDATGAAGFQPNCFTRDEINSIAEPNRNGVVAIPNDMVQPRMTAYAYPLRETRGHHFFQGSDVDNRYILETRYEGYPRHDSPDGYFFYRAEGGSFRSIVLIPNPQRNVAEASDQSGSDISGEEIESGGEQADVENVTAMDMGGEGDGELSALLENLKRACSGEDGIDINSPRDNLQGFPPVIFAAMYDHNEYLQLAMKNGANPNQMHGKVSPLLYAAERGNNDALDIIGSTREALNLNLTEPGSGMTALMKAIANEHEDFAMSLEGLGADIYICDINGKSLLMYAIEKELTEYAQHLIGQDIHINTADSLGWTPLHAACAGGLKELAINLVGKGADINAVETNSKDTPLTKVLQEGRSDKGGIQERYLEIAGVLVSKGANINHFTNDGYTPLILAAIFGDEELFIQMIQTGSVDLGCLFPHSDPKCIGKKHMQMLEEILKAYQNSPQCMRIDRAKSLMREYGIKSE